MCLNHEALKGQNIDAHKALNVKIVMRVDYAYAPEGM
jgi:hypothetical protein